MEKNNNSDKIIAGAVAIGVALLAWIIFSNATGITSSTSDGVSPDKIVAISFSSAEQKVQYNFQKGQYIELLRPYGYCIIYTPRGNISIQKRKIEQSIWRLKVLETSAITFRKIPSYDCGKHTQKPNEQILITGKHPLYKTPDMPENYYLGNWWTPPFYIPTFCETPKIPVSQFFKTEYKVMLPDGTLTGWLTPVSEQRFIPAVVRFLPIEKYSMQAKFSTITLHSCGDR
tara:strand:+ start:141 stop:830 length:690 start_codon:yes stop_codon:yes gene_type:complete